MDTHASEKDIPRRAVVGGAAKAGALVASGLALSSLLQTSAQATPQTDEKDKNSKDQDSSVPIDRQAVLAAGMTEAEADCWEQVASAAGAFFNLPELHPMDKTEVASAIHIIQNKLLGRPTYRKYREFHKANNKDAS